MKIEIIDHTMRHEGIPENKIVARNGLRFSMDDGTVWDVSADTSVHGIRVRKVERGGSSHDGTSVAVVPEASNVVVII